MGLTLVTPATVFPVTLAEAKDQLRVRHNDEDTYIGTLIAAATAYVERTLSMSIAEQQWKLTLDEFTDTIELPRGPVTEVNSVQYVDEAGDTQTASTSLYTVDLASRSPWVVLNSDESWPDTLSGINAVSVMYTAGMETVPADLKHAILLLIGAWYENRAGLTEKPLQQVPLAVDALLQSYRWVLV